MTKRNKQRASTRVRKGTLSVAVRRTSESPLDRLKRLPGFDVYEHTAADELIAAHRMSCGLMVERDGDLGIRSELRADAADNAAAFRVDMTAKFRQWKADLAGSLPLAITTAILFEEKTVRAVEYENFLRHGSARKHMRVALRHFAALRGNVPNGVRDWKQPRRGAAA